MKSIGWRIWITLGFQFEDLVRFVFGFKPKRFLIPIKDTLTVLTTWNQISPTPFPKDLIDPTKGCDINVVTPTGFVAVGVPRLRVGNSEDLIWEE